MNLGTIISESGVQVVEVLRHYFLDRSILAADSDTLTCLPCRNTGSHFVDDARDFVPGNARIPNSRPQAFFDKHITVANAAGFYLDAHMPRIELGNRTFGDLEVGAWFRNLRNFHWHCYWFRCDS
jgi:hypothetical protein